MKTLEKFVMYVVDSEWAVTASLGVLGTLNLACGNVVFGGFLIGLMFADIAAS